MGQNFIVADRDQAFLLPPRCGIGCLRITSRGRVWAAVEEMDLTRFTPRIETTGTAGRRMIRR